MVSGIIDTADHWSAVFLLPPTSGVTDTAEDKIGNFKVEFLGEYESIFKKALTRGSV
jgi:hypothetical protein